MISFNNPRQACYLEMGSAPKGEAQTGGVSFYGDEKSFRQVSTQIL